MYYITKHRNTDQSTLWRWKIETCLRTLKIVLIVKIILRISITVVVKTNTICQVTEIHYNGEISLFYSYNELKLTLKGWPHPFHLQSEEVTWRGDPNKHRRIDAFSSKPFSSSSSWPVVPHCEGRTHKAIDTETKEGWQHRSWPASGV